MRQPSAASQFQEAAPLWRLKMRRTSASLYTACQDGTITLWNLSTLSVAKQWNLESPICSLQVQDDTAYVSCHWRERRAGRLLAYNLAAHTAMSTRVKLSSASQLVISACGQLLASINRHTATVWQATSFPHHPLIVTHTKPLTDTGDTLAVGDATGRIVVWHGIRAAVQLGLPAPGCAHPAQQAAPGRPLVPNTTAHWHAGPVCCLAFTPGDTFLLSGGQEGVVVLWDIPSARRTYLPRLGSSLCHLATCINGPGRVAISLADNSVQLVDLGALRVERSVCGVFCDYAVPADSCTLVQPGTGFLTLAHKGTTLQYFDAARNTHVACHKLRSRVTPFTAAREVLVSRIAPTHIVFSRTGEMLVTVEQSPTAHSCTSAGYSKQELASVLRVWFCRQVPAPSCMLSVASEAGTFSIADAVKVLTVHPDRPLVTVALGDGSITSYEVGAFGGVEHKVPVDFCGIHAHALAYSADGSVLAVGATASCPIMLLDADAHRTLAALPPVTKAACPLPIQRLSFLADKIHLAAQWHGGVAVYSMLTAGLSWVCQLSATLMAADAHSARFVMGAQAGMLFVFEPIGPVNQGFTLSGGHSSCIRAARFLEPNCLARQGDPHNANPLVVLNDVQQFAIVVAIQRVDISIELDQPAAVQTCALDRKGVDSPKGSRSLLADVAVAEDLQATASHLLPAVEDICPMLLARLLVA
ncbi:hypothetical protein D9Q98_002578 [Chlorella vulgaris]|uniref:Uncharacterized protein n=1 Tax=Chlorella vulgaris TaxID=3077 RepID=A0A9D4TU37_CHLVU|nr:hypothetical protein D9Q98_002578 [Chlorella vulgaris]